MTLQTIFVLQIAADFIFCLVIFFLLARLRKFFLKAESPVNNQEVMLKMQNLIDQSQRDSERFLTSLDESCRRFNQLALTLESREDRLAGLLKEIDLKMEQAASQKVSPQLSSTDRDYTAILELLRRGLSVEEIAERTGAPSGEVLLVVELEKLKQRE